MLWFSWSLVYFSPFFCLVDYCSIFTCSFSFKWTSYQCLYKLQVPLPAATPSGSSTPLWKKLLQIVPFWPNYIFLFFSFLSLPQTMSPVFIAFSSSLCFIIVSCFVWIWSSPNLIVWYPVSDLYDWSHSVLFRQRVILCKSFLWHKLCSSGFCARRQRSIQYEGGRYFRHLWHHVLGDPEGTLAFTSSAKAAEILNEMLTSWEGKLWIDIHSFLKHGLFQGLQWEIWCMDRTACKMIQTFEQFCWGHLNLVPVIQIYWRPKVSFDEHCKHRHLHIWRREREEGRT